ncbi:hypothetical protein ACIG0C_15140 [Kitasatospora aureofaciens]|uniref:hypothetical protein n=1 Tax=Kitasatospora aureofaciens TaxID=1894 RepID=UPI00114CB212|nr:hypothetical protein [Kitasatospora aureofaciens]
MWLSGYVVLPIAGLHKPIWTYDAKTLGDDLTAHLAYGVVHEQRFLVAEQGFRVLAATAVRDPR